MASRHGTEIAFRLGSGNDDRARAWADALARAAIGASAHTLFLNEAGEYGCLAEWSSYEQARSYGADPAVAVVLGEMEAALGKRPTVRVYRMESQPVAGAPPA